MYIRVKIIVAFVIRLLIQIVYLTIFIPEPPIVPRWSFENQGL